MIPASYLMRPVYDAAWVTEAPAPAPIEPSAPRCGEPSWLSRVLGLLPPAPLAQAH